MDRLIAKKIAQLLRDGWYATEASTICHKNNPGWIDVTEGKIRYIGTVSQSVRQKTNEFILYGR